MFFKGKHKFALLFISLIVLLAVGAVAMNFRPGSKKTYSYGRDDSFILNPYIGYAPEADSELCDNTSLVYLNLLWSELEPEEGVYEWDEIEDEYDLLRHRKEGRNLVLRFVCDLPSDTEHMDIPQWLYDKTGDGKFYDIGYGRGYCPDYENETFINEHQKVIAEIGRHFSEDDFLAYVELGSLGHWGEWHTYYPAGIPQMPRTAVRMKYVEHYIEAFPYARLLMRRPFSELPDGVGVFNDMTGDSEDTGIWLDWIANGGEYDETGERDGLKKVPDVWDSAPVGGEFTSGIPMSVMLGNNLDETIDLVKNSHMSFIGPKVPDPEEDGDILKASEKVLLNVGYRYRVKSLTVEKPFASEDAYLTVNIINDGVAPIYFDRQAVLYISFPEGTDVTKYKKAGYDFGKEGTEAEDMLRFDLHSDLMKLGQGGSQSCSVTVPKKIIDSKDIKIYVGIEKPKSGAPLVNLNMNTPRMGKLSLLWEN